MVGVTYDYAGNPRKWFKHGASGTECALKLEWKESSLVGITDETANKKYEYTYNADGLRTGKTVDGVKHEYYLSGSKILAETRESGGEKKLFKYYYDDTGVVGFNLDGTDYYFVKSMQGDVEKIYSASGELKAEYSYDSWGKCAIKSSVSGIAEANAFRYRGYYFDGESGLYYLNSRYYDPIIGRFISPDSLDYLDPSALGGLNLYAYCGNNPIMYVDPEGRAWWHWLLGGLIVAALVVATILSAGGFGAGMIALLMAAGGLASSSMLTTIFAFAAVGAGIAFTAYAIASGIEAVITLAETGSFSSAVDVFMAGGEAALYGTLVSAGSGAIGGYVSYKDQIGDSSQAGFMDKNERDRIRIKYWKSQGMKDGKAPEGIELSHPYGTYGMNRYYFEPVSKADHRAFHAKYGYKTANGPFNRTNPAFLDWWSLIRRFFGGNG